MRDYAQVRADGVVTVEVARAAMRMLEVDDQGFDEIDRRLLSIIIDKFGGGPVGVNTLAAALSEEPDAIEDIHEPYLLQAGFLDRTPRGRVATARAYEYFGRTGAQERTVLRASIASLPGNALIGRAEIKSLATYVPPRVLTNADLEKLVETSDEWILQRTGIRERHIVEPGVGTSDLAKEAALEAIRRAGLTPDDIDLIIVGTVTPDMLFPSTACLLQHKIGANHAWGFDVSAACSAFAYSLTVGSQLIAAGSVRVRPHRRRRRDVEHHRLHRPHDLRAVRRRRRRGGARPVRRTMRSASSTSRTRSTAAAARRCACRRAAA